MAIYYFYKTKDKKFRTYDLSNKTFQTVSKLTYSKFNKNYFVFKGYETDEGVLQFIKDFDMWTEELKDLNIDYKKFKSHNGAIPLIVKNLCNHFDEFEDIDIIESQWIEKNNNSGILYLKKTGKHQCYGYDFKAFYLSIMGKKDLHYDIPLKAGKEATLKELDFYKLETGYYRVRIESNDKKFLFTYSKDDVYTNISLYYAFKCKKNGLDIKIELIHDGRPNAYLYGTTTKTGVHSSRYMFGKLYDELIKMKTKYPKNKLVKFICSSIWGHICEFNSKNISKEEFEETEMKISLDPTDEKADYYLADDKDSYLKLINIKQRYKFNCARMKPFLLSMGRNISANVANLYIDDVVRIHTDGIVFNKQHDDIMTKFKSYPTLLKEDKSTGLIDFQSINSYYNHTLKEVHGKYKMK